MKKSLLFAVVCCISLGVLQANDQTKDNTCKVVRSESYEARRITNPLEIAIIHNDIKEAETLIKNGADVNEYVGEVPILCQAISYDKNIGKLLIDNGAKVNVKCYFGETPLHKAVIDLDLVKSMIEKGADVNAKDDYGNTPLFYVQTKDIAEYLINNGADVNIVNKEGDTCLSYMIPHKDKDKEKFELFSYILPQVKNINNDKLLHQAVVRENIKIIKILIKKGADVNSVDENNISVLAKAKDRKTAKYLVSKGAKINDANDAIRAGKTDLAKQFINSSNYSDKEIAKLLYTAAYYNEIEIADLLLSKGVDTDVMKKALRQAILGGNLEMIKLLEKNGVNVNAEYEGVTPLYFATYANHPKIMKYLIKKGANVNAKSGNGNMSILLSACLQCNKEAIEILIKNKAEMLSENVALTPVDAVSGAQCNVSKKKEILKMMIKLGVDINMTRPYLPTKLTALDFAISNNHFEVAKMLVELGAKDNMALILSNNKEMSSFLLKNGFDINAKDDFGNTALDYAQTDEIKQLLISHGAKSGKELK